MARGALDERYVRLELDAMARIAEILADKTMSEAGWRILQPLNATGFIQKDFWSLGHPCTLFRGSLLGAFLFYF